MHDALVAILYPFLGGVKGGGDVDSRKLRA